jgi:hypothetical protein
MDLTLEQKRAVEQAFHKTPDLLSITREVFNDQTLKGSSKEGRAVRNHLLEKGLRYQTSRHRKADPIELSNKQRMDIERMAEEGMSSYAIARTIFTDRDVKKLGLEQRAVMAHIKTINPDFGAPKKGAMLDYSPPKATSRILIKINSATGSELKEDELSRQEAICVDKLGINMQNSRFVTIVNNYKKQEYRELFEEEFVRLTWDKPDLSADEVNLYMNVCKEIVHMEVITAHLERLNEDFDQLDGVNDMSMRLTELIKAKSDEYHKCEGRISNLTGKLQGNRAERIKKHREDNASILAIVQFVQDEKERQNMVRIAEIQREAIKEEANRLENEDMWIARVIGVAKDDVI